MFEISAGRWRASGFSGCLQTPRIEDPSNTQVGRAPWARAGIQIHNWGYPAGYPTLAGWLMEKPEKWDDLVGIPGIPPLMCLKIKVYCEK